jgi:hypothetical protein
LPPEENVVPLTVCVVKLYPVYTLKDMVKISFSYIVALLASALPFLTTEIVEFSPAEIVRVYDAL